MPDTLLQVAQRVARRLRVDNTFTSFSDNDESNNIVSYINDAYQALIDALPSDLPLLLDTTRTLSLVPNTRLYNLDASAHHWSLLEWSFSNSSNNNDNLRAVTLEWLQNVYPSYRTDVGVPQYVYQEGNESVGFYPLPNVGTSVSYKFSKPFTRLSATTDVFIVPDNWLIYIERQAQAAYANDKSFIDAATIAQAAEGILVNILVEAELSVPHSFIGGYYGQNLF